MKSETNPAVYSYIIAAREHVATIQASMAEAAGSRFSETELEDLRGVVRLTAEFYHFLKSEDVSSLSAEELRYVGDSVFSGVDSFAMVSAAIRGTTDMTPTTLNWAIPLSLESLQEQFAAKYENFVGEIDFEKRCRFLLDLFKLQIVFAGLTYE